MTSQYNAPTRWQFGLRDALATGVMIALWASSLGTGQQIYVKGLFTLSWVVMLFSLLAVYFRPCDRRFWTGFALFGWSYILFHFTDFFEARTHGYFFLDLIGPSIANWLPEAGTDASRGGLPFKWFVGTVCKIAMIVPVAYAGGWLSSYCFDNDVAP